MDCIKKLLLGRSMDRRQLTVTTMDDGCTQRLPKLKKTRKYLGSIDQENLGACLLLLPPFLDGQQKQQQVGKASHTNGRQESLAVVEVTSE